MADDPRQDRAGTHVAARQTDTREQEGRARRRGRVTQVGRHREDRAGAGADTVHRGGDRLRAGAHRLHQVAGHARESKQSVHGHTGQRRDDFVDVATGTEVAAGAGQHDGLHVGRAVQGAEQVAQLRVGFEGQRVLAFGAVESDDAHALLDAPAEVPGHVAGVDHAGLPAPRADAAPRLERRATVALTTPSSSTS